MTRPIFKQEQMGQHPPQADTRRNAREWNSARRPTRPEEGIGWIGYGVLQAELIVTREGEGGRRHTLSISPS